MDDKEPAPTMKTNGDVFDINGHSFNPDMFLRKILKEYSLKQVMDQEGEIVHDTQALHSDMQTLVYENYNKFISATDTVRKMKNDFKKMEEEMDLLCSKMDSITSFSEQISSTLQDSREKITKLSGVHTLLRRLQFLFRLPNKLKAQMQEGNYVEAVQDYLDTQRVLEQYGNLESFQGIQRDCSLILQQLKQQLYENFKSKESTAKELAMSVNLLLQLGEPADNLSAEFLVQAGLRLTHQLAVLCDQTVQDLIEFVDLGSNGFLNDLCFVVSSYNDMFINRTSCNEELSAVKLNQFVLEHNRQYFALVLHRIEEKEGGGDTGVLVHALDRFLRRLAAINALFTHTDFALAGLDIVIQAGRRQCKWHLICLKTHLSEWITRIRGSLATPRSGTDGETPQTAELVTALVVATVEKIKGVLQDLLLFLQPDLVFATKPQFVESFNIDSVREGLVVCFLHHLTATVRSFTSPVSPLPALPLLLVLAKMCLEFQATNVHYLLNIIDNWFSIEQHQQDRLTSESELCNNLGEAAQHVLNHYVRMQGLAISQMLRKSVETRDWMHSLEPRTVRAVMKRVMEEMTAVETQVGVLFEEGSRAERSSDSSHKTQSRHHRSTWSTFGTNSHHSLAATHINRIFNERVEIFAPVEFSKVSILTGIIKISLKTLLECVRLRTFSKYGLQQIQVDTHYLQLYLWRYVADENLVHFLLDEVLGSAVHRCLDPVLMEPGIVEIICERG